MFDLFVRVHCRFIVVVSIVILAAFVLTATSCLFLQRCVQINVKLDYL